MKTLTEKEAEDFLEKNKLKVAKRIFIKNPEEIDKIKIPFPWVAKISSMHIVHKAKIGGTILNINNLKEAKRAFEKLSKIDKFEGALIQEMIQGEEVIIGIKNTPEFGRVIMFGKGGTNVEEEKDVSFRMLPVKEKDVKEMINEISFINRLKEKNVNLKEIEKVTSIIAKIAEKDKIEELDINPLIVNSKEAKIADARIILD